MKKGAWNAGGTRGTNLAQTLGTKTDTLTMRGGLNTQEANQGQVKPIRPITRKENKTKTGSNKT